MWYSSFLCTLSVNLVDKFGSASRIGRYVTKYTCTPTQPSHSTPAHQHNRHTVHLHTNTIVTQYTCTPTQSSHSTPAPRHSSDEVHLHTNTTVMKYTGTLTQPHGFCLYALMYLTPVEVGCSPMALFSFLGS